MIVPEIPRPEIEPSRRRSEPQAQAADFTTVSENDISGDKVPAAINEARVDPSAGDDRRVPSEQIVPSCTEEVGGHLGKLFLARRFLQQGNIRMQAPQINDTLCLSCTIQ